MQKSYENKSAIGKQINARCLPNMLAGKIAVIMAVLGTNVYIENRLYIVDTIGQ